MLILGIVDQQQALVTGDFESIATTVVGAGGVSDVTFSSIPSTYQHLQIRSNYIPSAANIALTVQVNNDTAANYAWHRLYGDGASAIADAGSSASLMYLGFGSSTTSNVASFILDILDYKDTNKNKTFRSLNGSDRNGATGFAALNSGLWRKSPIEAITSIKIYPSSGSFNQNSHFALYGIKG